MAGRKYVCLDCGFTAWMPRLIACMKCGSDNIKTAYSVSFKEKTCVSCKRTFTPSLPKQKTCDTVECKKIYRAKREKAIRDKNREMHKCSFCGLDFIRRSGSQTICTRDACRKKRDIERRAKVKESVNRRELLGPDKPLMPMRKCHTPSCNNMSYNCWCPKCQGRRALNHDIEGRSAMSDLFSGGHINVEVAY